MFAISNFIAKMIKEDRGRCALKIILGITLVLQSDCYEKTLRKIVRDQSKMVQRPFSVSDEMLKWKNSSLGLPQTFMHPGFTQVKSVVHKIQRPKISTILSSVETNKVKSTYSKIKMDKNLYEVRQARDTFANLTNELNKKNDIAFPDFNLQDPRNKTIPESFAIETYYQVPQSNFFPTFEDVTHIDEQKASSKVNSVVNLEYPKTREEIKLLVKGIIYKQKEKLERNEEIHKPEVSAPVFDESDSNMEKADLLIKETQMKPNMTLYLNTAPVVPLTCNNILEASADIDIQKKFLEIDIEPPWTTKKQYWNNIYDSRYASLMRNPKWPSLKVILMPRTHVDTIWKNPFEDHHNFTVRKILSNVIKKLQFYSNLTFTWNEVSHLSQWWKTASNKNRAIFRRLVNEERLEITTGLWVETDEATTSLFGLIHQLIEGHQWLQHNLNYSPDVAWLTNSVTHSPTLPYLLNACEISNLVITNIHFSLEQYLAEYQYSDFVWVQNWDSKVAEKTPLNDALNKIGHDRFFKHSVLTHFLQFNSDGFKACGPDSKICMNEFNFGKFNKNSDINSYNVKTKSETLLEQYSKTGTLSPHNIIMMPIGGPYHYETQNEFDYQYNNYMKIAEFINTNQDIYRASVDFGTPKDYFQSILHNYKSYPKLKGDFLNFAEISSGIPAYWTGFFTSRPLLKILLRRLESTLRSTEILFSFALSYNSFRANNSMAGLFERLLTVREVVARLQDRNVVSGTLTAKAVTYVHKQILNTIKHCWYIQEVAISQLTSKSDKTRKYVEKYVFRNGEFVSSFKPTSPGDQIYIFNSLSKERTEVIELISRYPNLRIVDHDKKDVTIQINPIWKYTSDNTISISRQFYKILFTIILPPMGLGLFNIKDTYDSTLNAATIYCTACIVENIATNTIFPFNIQPITIGDIQIENYRHRLIFDEFSGFLKTVVEKASSRERLISINYGAFLSSHINSGIFLFNTNISQPIQDILLPFRTGPHSKIGIIISGQLTTEVTTIYSKLLQHTVKLFNLLQSPLDSVISVESKVDYGITPNNRELEMFLSFQTDVANGHLPEVFTDNNGFQYTLRSMNISRRIESNMYPMTSMAFIQDKRSRFTVLTDHAQGVTALQEGQLLIMLDRRVLFNDNRGTGEGIADSTSTTHTHYILIESFSTSETPSNRVTSKSYLKLPSISALGLANLLDYQVDIYFVDRNRTNLLYFALLPLVKTSFPCDLTIINYRVELKSKSSTKNFPNSALLTLHRQSFSCEIDFHNDLTCNGDSDFDLFKIFRNLKQVYQTNLVGTNKGISVRSFTLNNFPSMEIITLRVYFEFDNV